MLSKEKYFLVLDAGTTNIKAAVVSSQGKFIDVRDEAAEVLMPFNGACEMNMDTVWETTKSVIKKLRDSHKDIWADICAMGISAQGDGLWMMDSAGNPVRNAILWNDTRTVMDFDSINSTCLSLNTCALFPGANAAILTWLKKKEPQNYSRIAHIFHCKDWLNYQLTGHIGTDATDGSTAVMDIYTKEYSFDLLDQLNLSEVKHAFAPIFKSDEIIGCLKEDVAQELGLSVDVSVIAGALDVLAIATGCALVAGGQRGSIIGTTLANYVVMNEETARNCVATNGSILCHTKENTYIRLMAALSGASSLDWMNKEILRGENYAAVDEKISKIPIGSDGVMSTPYIYGERAPFKLNSASGGYYGIRANHTKYHLARASFEGMVMSMLDCFENLPRGDAEIYVAGGGAKSRCICQMICDSLGATTYRFSNKELGLLGIYRLILTALGIDNDATSDMDRFEPDMENHVHYRNLYKEFILLKESLMPFWKSRLGKE